MDEYQKQAIEFLKEANATLNIRFVGLSTNKNWEEKERRNLYEITLTTPKGSMIFDFWDSIYNTEISTMDIEEYAKKRFHCEYKYLTFDDSLICRVEFSENKKLARPSEYDILSCLSKYDPGTFEDFCAEYGYCADSIRALNIYRDVQKEYSQLVRIFTPEQMEMLAEIN